MAEQLTREEFIRRARGGGITVEAISEAATTSPPSSAAAAFAQRRNAEDLSRLSPGAETLRQRLGEEVRVPLDIETGLGAGVEFELARRPTKEEKLRYLARQFGADKVRLNKEDEPIVRITDPSGKERDILVNARGLSVADLGAVAAHAPELAGALLGPGIAARIAGVNPATMSALAKVFAGAIGAEVGGTAQDIATRLEEGTPLQPAEITTRRGTSALVNTALGGAGLAGAKATQLTGNALFDVTTRGPSALLEHVPSPVRLMRGPIQQSAVQAADRIEAITGQRLGLSLGQSSGNPFVATAEAYLEAAQAGTGPQLAARVARENERRLLQDYLVNPSTLASDEEIGRRGIGILANAASTADEAVNTAIERVQQEGQRSIRDLLSQRFNRQVAPRPAVIGQTVRDSAVELRDAFRAESSQRWNALYSHPNAAALQLELTPVYQTSSEILSKWPKDPKTGELISNFGPEGLLSRIQKAASLSEPQRVQTGMLGTTRPETMPLDELHQLRVLLDQQITGGQAISGIKDQKLISLRGAITEAIETGVEKDPQLHALWRSANDYTKENSQRFTNKNIATLFRDPEQGSFVGDSDFIASLSTSEDKYKAVQNFFGRSSDEMRLVNRNIADDILRKSLSSGFGDEIDAQALHKNLTAFHGGKTTRDIFYGVFGKRADDILVELKAMDVTGKLKGEKLSASELAASLDPSTSARPSIAALLASQRDSETIYANNIIKRYVKGEIGVANIRGEDFVNKWLDSADASEVRAVMNKVRAEDPDIAEQLARKTLQKFFAESARAPVPSDVLQTLQGAPGIPSGLAMSKTLGDQASQTKLREVLGTDTFELLKDFIRVELSDDEKRRLAAGTGIMTKGSFIGSIIHGKGGLLKEASDFARIKALSYMMTRPQLSRWIASEYTSRDLPDAVKTIITSEPFLAALADDLKGDSKAFEVLSNLKHAVFGDLQQTREPSRSQVPTMTREEFIQRARPQP